MYSTKWYNMRVFREAYYAKKSIRNQTVILNTDSHMTKKQVASTSMEVPTYSPAWPQYGLKKTCRNETVGLKQFHS